jgi:hypothetical protein
MADQIREARQQAPSKPLGGNAVRAPGESSATRRLFAVVILTTVFRPTTDITT